MTVKIMVLICMMFFHIVDDYYLQGWLASAKRKDWWQKNAPDELYKYDYLMALFMHSFSWTFMISLPLTIYGLIFDGAWYPILFIANIVIHAITDNAKCNCKKINLLQDQIIHMAQIVVTWALLLFVY